MRRDILVKQYSRGRGGESIGHIVLHYSVSGGTAAEVAHYFRNNPRRTASYHYIIGRDGEIIRCVHEENTAWHAAGRAPGEADVIPRQNNRRSIGICLVNWGYDGPEELLGYGPAKPVRGGRSHRWQPYTEQQYEALTGLIKELRRNWSSLTGICGHEDCAAKADPGPAFDWSRLAGLGLTRWTYRGGAWTSAPIETALEPLQGWLARFMDAWRRMKGL